MLRIARRVRATDQRLVDGTLTYGHVFDAEAVDIVLENLPHEFAQIETLLNVDFGRDGELRARWPVDAAHEGGFFAVRDNDVVLRAPRDVRGIFPTIGVVPVLSPLEQDEELLSEDYVRRSLDTRLASRHFRNQLRALQQTWNENGRSDFDEWVSFAELHTPELALGELRVDYSGDAPGFDLMYSEPTGRFEREICWAGDGMQIWLQLLLHLWRLRDADVLLLDEPEVFLHADLQRRLVAVLAEHPAQTIMATHSSEVLAEASATSVVWVDKSRRRTVRGTSSGLDARLVETLGSAYNLRIARALKSRAVLFVEGQDVKVLRSLAARLGVEEIAKDGPLAVLPLHGFERWAHVEPFQWLMREFVGPGVPVTVVLDRDYRTDDDAVAIEQRLESVGVSAHVWRRHELENYLIEPIGISRATGFSIDAVNQILDDACEELKSEVHSGVLSATAAAFGKGIADKTAVRAGQARFDELWSTPASRRTISPGKELIQTMNRLLGPKSVSTARLARELRPPEVSVEVRQLLRRVASGVK